MIPLFAPGEHLKSSDNSKSPYWSVVTMSPPPPPLVLWSVPSSTTHPFAGNESPLYPFHPVDEDPSNAYFHPAAVSAAVSGFGGSAIAAVQAKIAARRTMAAGVRVAVMPASYR